MGSGTEARQRTELVQFRTLPHEKARLTQRAAESGYATVADYLRDVALGGDGKLRRPRAIEVPMTAEERALVGRRAADNGFENVTDYARRRLLDRDTEGYTVSRAIMELRRMTGLQKHLFNNDRLRTTEYADLLLRLGDAIEDVCKAARRLRS